VTRTHQQLSLEIIYEVTNRTLTLGANLSLVAWGFRASDRTATRTPAGYIPSPWSGWTLVSDAEKRRST